MYRRKTKEVVSTHVLCLKLFVTTFTGAHVHVHVNKDMVSCRDAYIYICSVS